MNTILRSKMEREIEPNWECDYVTIARPHARVLAVDNGDVVFRRGNCAPATYSLRAITHVRPPGGEWLRVVDDPKVGVGSVWRDSLGNYAVVTKVTKFVGVVVTYEMFGNRYNGHIFNTTINNFLFVNTPVDSSRIVEGMDGGRLRRFVKHDKPRIIKSGEDVWYEESSGKVCKWGVDCASYKPLQVLVPLNFVTPATPSITPATPSTSSVHNETELEGGTKRLAEIIGEGNGWKVVVGHKAKRHVIVGEREDGSNGTHWVKWDYYYYGNRCGAYLQMPEPVDYKLPADVTIISATSPDGTTYRVDGLRVFVTPTVKESLQVDPLSWDANPPMVGDFVQDKDGHRMMITTQYSDGKVVVGEYDSDPIELSRDELKQKGYVRLILSPLHKEAAEAARGATP